MLSRPSYQSPPAADRATFATMGSLVGILLGVLGLSAVLWVNGLMAQLRDQSGKINDLDVALRDNTATQRMALDALLKKSEADGGPSGSVLESYKKTLRDLDEYRAKFDTVSSLAARLDQEAKTLRDGEKTLQGKLDKAEGRAREYESEAKEAKALRGDLARARDEIARQEATIAGKNEQLDATGDADKAAALIARARWGTYLAVAGWAVAVLLGVALAAHWTYTRPISAEDTSPPPPTPPAGEAPHVIS